MLVDVAALITGGGDAISDIDVLRHQSEVLVPVASAPTVGRALDEVTPAAAKRIERARAKVRAHVWSQLKARGGLPASKVADTDMGDTVVLDVDATLVAAHSEKQGAAVTFKKGLGYHPLGVWCEATQESLALMLRPDNAGSDTAADHMAVLTARDQPSPHALPTRPPDPRRRRRPRPGGLDHRTAHQTRPNRGVLSRVRDHRQGP